MMIKPGITTLSKCVDSRYTLVTMAAKRARMIGANDEVGLVKSDCNKSVSIAVNEIAAGKVSYIRSETIKRAEEWEAEKAAAIVALNDRIENIDNTPVQEVQIDQITEAVEAE